MWESSVGESLGLGLRGRNRQGDHRGEACVDGWPDERERCENEPDDSDGSEDEKQCGRNAGARTVASAESAEEISGKTSRVENAAKGDGKDEEHHESQQESAKDMEYEREGFKKKYARDARDKENKLQD